MFKELLAYFRNPVDQFDETATTSFKVKRLFAILGIDLAFAMAAGLLITLVDKLDLIDMENHAVADALGNFSIWQLILVAVLITPFFEELVFRLTLRFQANPVAGLARLVSPNAGPEANQELAAGRRAWWDRNYRWIFYGFAITFAYVHLANYPDRTAALWLLSPILVAPQFVMGALGGYLRTKFGFLWTFLLHALHNFLLVGFALLGSGATEVINTDNDYVQLKVEEVSPMDQEKDFAHTFGVDTIGFKNTELEEVIRNLVATGGKAKIIVSPEGTRNPRLNIGMKRSNEDVNLRQTLLHDLEEHYNFEVETPASDTAAYRIYFE